MTPRFRWMTVPVGGELPAGFRNMPAARRAAHLWSRRTGFRFIARRTDKGIVYRRKA